MKAHVFRVGDGQMILDTYTAENLDIDVTDAGALIIDMRGLGEAYYAPSTWESAVRIIPRRGTGSMGPIITKSGGTRWSGPS